MPTYSYRCGCGERIDRTYPMYERPDVVHCPKCGKEMKRVFTPVAVRPWGMR